MAITPVALRVMLPPLPPLLPLVADREVISPVELPMVRLLPAVPLAITLILPPLPVPTPLAARATEPPVIFIEVALRAILPPLPLVPKGLTLKLKLLGIVKTP